MTDASRWVPEEAARAAWEVWDSLGPNEAFHVRQFLDAAAPFIRAAVLREAAERLLVTLPPADTTEKAQTAIAMRGADARWLLAMADEAVRDD